MRKILLGLALSVGLAVPAQAMTYFLQAQWFERGGHFCKYGNGTVLNVGANICPLSIEG